MTKREQALALHATGISIREVARRLDIPETTAQGWLGTTEHTSMDEIRARSDERREKIVWMHEHDGMGVRAIARELECSPTTVIKALER
jgi:transposase